MPVPPPGISLQIIEARMSFPRSEFTFSAATVSSSGASVPMLSFGDEGETPPARSRQSPSIPRSLPRTSPPPTFQFQGLNIANQSQFTTAAGSSPREPSLLSPSRSASTYADQHNASPSPTPPRVVASRIGQYQGRQSSIVPNPTVFTDAREHQAEPLASETCTGNIQVPGAYPESFHFSDRSVPPVPGESRNANQKTIREESLPRVAIYDSRLQTQLKEVKGKLTSLATTIRSSALVHDKSSSLHAHYQNVQKASNFEYPESRTVGFIGDSGVGKCLLYSPTSVLHFLTLELGKSSLINSLLDQGGLSRSVHLQYLPLR